VVGLDEGALLELAGVGELWGDEGVCVSGLQWVGVGVGTRSRAFSWWVNARWWWVWAAAGG